MKGIALLLLVTSYLPSGDAKLIFPQKGSMERHRVPGKPSPIDRLDLIETPP